MVEIPESDTVNVLSGSMAANASIAGYAQRCGDQSGVAALVGQPAGARAASSRPVALLEHRLCADVEKASTAMQHNLSRTDLAVRLSRRDWQLQNLAVASS